MKIGILTGGGDCPGLNAVIRAIVRKGIFHHNDQFVGFLEGWRGVLENNTRPLDLEAVKGILPQGGTILRTSRTNPSKKENGLERCIENLKKNGIEALIALGGDDTQSVSLKLFDRGVKVVAVPKTIDNDLTGTDLCFGFDTAVSIATEAIDRVHTTAEAHNRVIVVEVMGREAGWIALYSGVAGGADVILIPEQPFDIQEIADTIKAAPRSRTLLQHHRGGGRRQTGDANSRHASAERQMNLGTCGWAESATRWPRKSSPAPALRHAPWSLATSSAAARQRLLIACWPPATALAPLTWCIRANSAAWWRSREMTSVRCPLPTPWPRRVM